MITGKVKFFSLNAIDNETINTIIVNDNTDPASLFYSGEEWVSQFARDTRIDGFNVNFPAKEVDTILILNHNLKSFRINHEGFRNVTDINNNQLPNGSIRITNNTSTTSYFKFDPFDPDRLGVQFLTTMIPNQNKRVGQFILCKELGTLIGVPEIQSITHDNNSRAVKSKTGAYFITKQRETVKIYFNFRNYNHEEDLFFMNRLNNYQEDFLIWLSGGIEDFRFKSNGYLLGDVFKVNIARAIKESYDKGNYYGLLRAVVDFEEVV